MKRSQKNIFSCILLVLSTLLFFDVCFQENKIDYSIELAAEDTSATHAADIDSDLSEEVHIIFQMEPVVLTVFNTVHTYFHFSTRSARPFLAVWQPPKLI